MLDIHANKIIANKFVGEFENSNNNDGFNIGDIKWSATDLTQVGFLVANGSSVRRDTYIDLFNAIGTRWGSVDEDHFNLPNLIGKFAEGSESVGGYKDAGLPNIEGNAIGLDIGRDSQQEFNGAIMLSNRGGNAFSASSGTVISEQAFNFNASRSNPIYGNSSTVQPPSVLLTPYIKAFKGASVTSTDLEITKVANEVMDKANRDLSNLSEIGRKAIVDGDLTENGWTKLANGLILQWGSHHHGDISDNTARTLSFNIPFPNKCLQVIVSTSETGAGCGFALRVGEPTTTAFGYAMNEFSSVVQKTTILWFAVGY